MIGVDGPRVSVVIPAYNEGENIVAPLARLVEGVQLDFEVVVVVDFPEDTTVPVIEKLADRRAADPGGGQQLRARPGQRDPVRDRRAAGARPWW